MRSLTRAVMFCFLAGMVVAGQEAQPKRAPDVPYVPTTEQAVEAMLKLAGVKSTDVVYDLGCGDGRIVISAVKKYGARGVGIDINPVRIKEANENAKKEGVEGKVQFIEKDLFEADVKELGRLSSLVEAASLNASEADLRYKIGALLNSQM